MEDKKRLINVNYALQQIEVGENENGGQFQTDSSHIKDFLNVLPAVDAVEVVHGRWEQHPKYDDYEWCSACHDCLVAKGWEQKSKLYYCPNCGAKMDKENID